jgi:hypothetical protein
MGSTLPPFSQLIQDERRVWTPYRRALRWADQAVVAHLFECAKRHVQAEVYLSCCWLFEVLVWSEGSGVRVSGETRELPSTGDDSVVHVGVEPRERQVPAPWLPPPVLPAPDRIWTGSSFG